jgi:ABC-type lipoprotein release transport system permease subunit
MIQLFKMAWRDLGRNRRRSFFSALALGMGLALLLLMASVITGEMRDSMNATIRLQSGHLQVRALDYNDNNSSLAWDDLIEDPFTVAAQVAAMPAVKAATPQLYASGVVSRDDESIGVRILGVDPASEALAPYRDGLVSGAFVQAGDREGILMGQTLADKLSLKTGDEVYLLVNTSSGDVAEQVFTIRGIFNTHTPAIDQYTLIMPLDKAQAISEANNHASSIFILLNNTDQTAAVADALQSSRYQIRTYEDANALMTQLEGMSDAYMMVLYLIVLGITATVIVNTLIMSVFERTREIGILAAMGTKPGSIMAMFFAESSLLAVGGILMGLVLGGLLVAYATYVGFYIGQMGMTGVMLGDRIHGYLTLKNTLTLTITAFIVTLLAALYPAVLAARMEPVQALRGGK